MFARALAAFEAIWASLSRNLMAMREIDEIPQYPTRLPRNNITTNSPKPMPNFVRILMVLDILTSVIAHNLRHCSVSHTLEHDKLSLLGNLGDKRLVSAQ